MRTRVLLSAFAVTFIGLVAPAAAQAAPVHTQTATAASHHACTRTSSHTCIRGGEFCPQSKYKKSGWDAHGRRYVCKGNRTHPHWEIP